MQAHVLSLNDFNRPRVYKETDSAYIEIVRLILLEPGKYQSHPTMGVGIRSRYRHNNDENFLINLQNEITAQISAFLPELTQVAVSVSIKDTILGIVINTATSTYALAYNTKDDTIDTGATYVLDDL